MNPECSSARPAEAEAIASLVNRAYRPVAGMAGWTHETALVHGQRTSADQVRALIQQEPTIFVLREAGQVVGCVHVKVSGPVASIGMLATEPTLQGKGLGSRLLREAELQAVLIQGVEFAQLEVLDRRVELISYYQRRGYRPTGIVSAYPTGKGLGEPAVADLAVIQMTKGLRSAICVRSPV